MFNVHFPSKGEKKETGFWESFSTPAKVMSMFWFCLCTPKFYPMSTPNILSIFSAHTRGVEIRYILSMRPDIYIYIYILIYIYIKYIHIISYINVYMAVKTSKQNGEATLYDWDVLALVSLFLFVFDVVYTNTYCHVYAHVQSFSCISCGAVAIPT